MICVFNIGNENFTGNGDAVMTPTSGKIRQAAGGSYDITLEHPIDPEGKWRHLVPGAVVRVPVPKETIPNAYAGMEADVYKVTSKTDMREGPSEPTTITYNTWSQYSTYSVGSKVTQGGKNYQCIYWDGNSTGRATAPSGSSWWEQIPNKTSGAAAIMSLNPGTELYFVEDYDGTWYKMSTTYGLVGYVKAAYLTFDRHLSPSETKPRIITEQLFRLKEPTINTQNNTVSVTGQHVSYDLAGVLVQDISICQASPAMAIGRMTGAFMMDYRGTIATNLTDTDNGTYTEEFHGKNAVYALMDPDKGSVSSFDAKLSRDNWDFFVMKKDASPQTSYIFRYGENMRGVTWKRSSSELVTRVVPVAKDEGGADLYLPEVYIDSSRINDYPVVMMERLSVKGQVGKETEAGSGTTWTESALLDEMRAKAAERFSVDKADQVRSEITIQFEQLGGTEEYAWLKPLESVLLYDTVKVLDERINLNQTLEVTEIEYDIIKKKLTGIKLSNMDSVEGRSVTGYNVHNNSIAKEKLMDGVVDDIVQQVLMYTKTGLTYQDVLFVIRES